MEAINFSKSECVPLSIASANIFCSPTVSAVAVPSVSGYWCGGQGDVGPWVLADLENGLWGCGTPGAHNNNNTPLTSLFVTAMVKGGISGFALKGGSATEGSLQTMYDGPRPPGYQPMKKQGAISECFAT